MVNINKNFNIDTGDMEIKYTEEEITRLLAYADPGTAAAITARLKLIGALKALEISLREQREVIGGIVDDMKDSCDRLSEAVNKL